MEWLRKLLAIALVAVFGLPLFSSLLALRAGGEEARLPACCRRNGAHHCGMSMAERQEFAVGQHRFSAPAEKCPFAPTALLPAPHVPLFSPTLAQLFFAGMTGLIAIVAQADSLRRVSRDRSRHKRGPPALFFA